MDELNLLRQVICNDLALIKVANNLMLKNNEDLKIKIIKNDCIGNRYEMLNILDANNEKISKINALITDLLDDSEKKNVQSTREVLNKICGGADELY